jgi:lipopolysaccharide/colanic/teichoic acid biosynthesis glycosyltransferase
MPDRDLVAMGARGRAFYEKELSEAAGVRATLAVLYAAVSARRGSVLKRGFDLITAGVALVVLSPVMIVTAAVLAWDLGFPVLCQQLRPGLLGLPPLQVSHDARVARRDRRLLPDARGLTRRQVCAQAQPGRAAAVMNHSGDMSLVGPRPLLAAYLDRYPEQARRHEVRPGITGWAQVNGRNANSWDHKLDLDIWYVAIAPSPST